MKIVAITAEFDPMHLGHLRPIEKAKALSPDLLLVIMNGDFTQRGEAALLGKYTRAKHALQAGADAVIELPQLFGVACAERFADAAVKLLSALPAEEKILLFGSEEGGISPLKNAADILSDEPIELSVDLRELLDMGFSYPVARAQAFSDYAAKRKIPIADLTKPNNILAIEYLRAARKRGGVTAMTIKREGDYDTKSIRPDAPSASAIRLALREGRREEAFRAVPPYVAADLGKSPPTDDLSPLLLYKLTETTPDELSEIADVREGIENRILRLARESADSESLVKAVAGKRYTEARVRRILVNNLLRIRKEDFDREIDAAPYYKVLAIKKARTDLLSLFSKAGKVLTGEQEAKESGIPSALIDAKAHDLYRIVKRVPDEDDGMVLL